MSRETKLVKNTIILSIGTFLPKAVSFITLPIITGYLSQDEYGTYDLILTLVSLILPVATLQIQTAAFRFLIDHRGDKANTKKVISNILVFVLPISILALCVLFIAMFRLPLSTRTIVCLYFFGDILANIGRQIARGISKNFDYSISAIISSFGQMLCVVLLVYLLKGGLNGALFALAFAECISVSFLFFKIKLFTYIDLTLFDKVLLKEMLSYSWPMIPNSLSMWVMRASDRLVISLFLGVGANAVYAVANKLPQILTIAQTTFSMAWQENASIAVSNYDAPSYYSKMFRIMFDLMSGIMALLISCTPIMFVILIKGDYKLAYIHIPILYMAMLFYALSSFLGGIYVAYKETKNVGITTLVAAICNLTIDLATIKWFGLFSASGSTLVSYFFLFVFRMINIRKIVNIRCNNYHIVIVLMVLFVECVLCGIRTNLTNCINAIIGLGLFVILNYKLMYAAVVNILNKFEKGKL